MVFDDNRARKRAHADHNVVRLDNGVEINRFDRNYFARILKYDHEISAEKHEQLGHIFEQDGAMQKAFFHYKSAIRKSDGQQAEEIEQIVKRLFSRGFVDTSPNFKHAEERMDSYIRIAKWFVAALVAVNLILLLMNFLKP